MARTMRRSKRSLKSHLKLQRILSPRPPKNQSLQRRKVRGFHLLGYAESTESRCPLQRMLFFLTSIFATESLDDDKSSGDEHSIEPRKKSYPKRKASCTPPRKVAPVVKSKRNLGREKGECFCKISNII